MGETIPQNEERLEELKKLVSSYLADNEGSESVIPGAVTESGLEPGELNAQEYHEILEMCSEIMPGSTDVTQYTIDGRDPEWSYLSQLGQSHSWIFKKGRLIS